MKSSLASCTTSQTSVRLRLRDATGDAHRDLEHCIGRLDTLEAYAAYVAGSYMLRQALEPYIVRPIHPEAPAWKPTYLREHLADDLQDLGIVAASKIDMPMSNDTASLLGVCYVLEGSSLGARVVMAQARRLGVAPNCGARHLAHQIASVGNWKTFLEWLEEVEQSNFRATAEAATATFRSARIAMASVSYARA